MTVYIGVPSAPVTVVPRMGFDGVSGVGFVLLGSLLLAASRRRQLYGVR